MVDIVRKSLICREVWFDEKWSSEGADLVLFYHWSSSPVGANPSIPVFSLEIDLTMSESDIWRGLSASTRNQINRGVKEGIIFRCWSQPDRAVLNEFFSFHRQFMGERGLSNADPHWMSEYGAQGLLTLTNASMQPGGVQVWHSYYRNLAWVRQLHSISLFATQDDRELRNAIGRANRFLHWMDIQHFQKCSAERFDFGGWYPGSSDVKLLQVNAFKEAFGGVKTQRFHSTQAISIKGKLYLKTRSLLRNNPGQLHWV